MRVVIRQVIDESSNEKKDKSKTVSSVRNEPIPKRGWPASSLSPWTSSLSSQRRSPYHIHHAINSSSSPTAQFEIIKFYHHADTEVCSIFHQAWRTQTSAQEAVPAKAHSYSRPVISVSPSNPGLVVRDKETGAAISSDVQIEKNCCALLSAASYVALICELFGSVHPIFRRSSSRNGR